MVESKAISGFKAAREQVRSRQAAEQQKKELQKTVKTKGTTVQVVKTDSGYKAVKVVQLTPEAQRVAAESVKQAEELKKKQQIEAQKKYQQQFESESLKQSLYFGDVQNQQTLAARPEANFMQPTARENLAIIDTSTRQRIVEKQDKLIREEKKVRFGGYLPSLMSAEKAERIERFVVKKMSPLYDNFMSLKSQKTNNNGFLNINMPEPIKYYSKRGALNIAGGIGYVAITRRLPPSFISSAFFQSVEKGIGTTFIAGKTIEFELASSTRGKTKVAGETVFDIATFSLGAKVYGYAPKVKRDLVGSYKEYQFGKKISTKISEKGYITSEEAANIAKELGVPKETKFLSTEIKAEQLVSLRGITTEKAGIGISQTESYTIPITEKVIITSKQLKEAPTEFLVEIKGKEFREIRPLEGSKITSEPSLNVAKSIEKDISIYTVAKSKEINVFMEPIHISKTDYGIGGPYEFIKEGYFEAAFQPITTTKGVPAYKFGFEAPGMKPKDISTMIEFKPTLLKEFEPIFPGADKSAEFLEINKLGFIATAKGIEPFAQKVERGIGTISYFFKAGPKKRYLDLTRFVDEKGVKTVLGKGPLKITGVTTKYKKPTFKDVVVEIERPVDSGVGLQQVVKQVVILKSADLEKELGLKKEKQKQQQKSLSAQFGTTTMSKAFEKAFMSKKEFVKQKPILKSELRFKEVTISKEATLSKQKQFVLSKVAQKTKQQPELANLLKQEQKLSQKQIQKQYQQLGTATLTIPKLKIIPELILQEKPPVPKIPIIPEKPGVPKKPPFKFPEFKLSMDKNKYLKKRKWDRDFKYQYSLVAKELGIKGRPKGMLTGLEVRGV